MADNETRCCEWLGMRYLLKVLGVLDRLSGEI
jgi:hypothetical protein